MLKTIESLLRLQELEITLREARIVHADDEELVAGLSAQVRQLRGDIDPPLLARYDRQSRHGPGVVHVASGTCTGCNMGIPVGDLNRIATGKVDPVCPHCGKFVCPAP